MKQSIIISVLFLALASHAFAAQKSRKVASIQGCSIAQVMTSVHRNRAYAQFEYAGNYNGEQGPPTQKQHESNDQYLFWVDHEGQTCPAIVTYEAGKCAGGAAVVKTSDCQ